MCACSLPFSRCSCALSFPSLLALLLTCPLLNSSGEEAGRCVCLVSPVVPFPALPSSLLAHVRLAEQLWGRSGGRAGRNRKVCACLLLSRPSYLAAGTVRPLTVCCRLLEDTPFPAARLLLRELSSGDGSEGAASSSWHDELDGALEGGPERLENMLCALPLEERVRTLGRVMSLGSDVVDSAPAEAALLMRVSARVCDVLAGGGASAAAEARCPAPWPLVPGIPNQKNPANSFLVCREDGPAGLKFSLFCTPGQGRLHERWAVLAQGAEFLQCEGQGEWEAKFHPECRAIQVMCERAASGCAALVEMTLADGRRAEAEMILSKRPQVEANKVARNCSTEVHSRSFEKFVSRQGRARAASVDAEGAPQRKRARVEDQGEAEESPPVGDKSFFREGGLRPLEVPPNKADLLSFTALFESCMDAMSFMGDPSDKPWEEFRSFVENPTDVGGIPEQNLNIECHALCDFLTKKSSAEPMSLRGIQEKIFARFGYVAMARLSKAVLFVYARVKKPVMATDVPLSVLLAHFFPAENTNSSVLSAQRKMLVMAFVLFLGKIRE